MKQNEDYNSGGLPLRSCEPMHIPHVAHVWDHPEIGRVHCWGRNALPEGAVEKYCTPGCDCMHCSDIRNGHRPRFIMCAVDWRALSSDQRVMIGESASD